VYFDFADGNRLPSEKAPREGAFFAAFVSRSKGRLSAGEGFPAQSKDKHHIPTV